MNQVYNNKLSIAPMLDWTDRHCRYFHRLISPNALLYTEMITTAALIHGDREHLLRYNPAEHPLALQLGGSDPADLAACAKWAEEAGYDEVNLNCGCPSERVQKGAFGACLMKEASLVASCVAAMRGAIKIPVTLKCRIGVDEHDSLEFLSHFISTVKNAGCSTFIIHARKAWLKGLSPKENRSKPPIMYDRAAQIKALHPDTAIILNGEIKTTKAAQEHLKTFNGVMLGRAVYENPYLLHDLEVAIFGEASGQVLPSRNAVAEAMIPYIAQQMRDYSTPPKSITRHMTGLFHGLRGARKWRQLLSTLPYKEGANEGVLLEALQAIEIS